MLPEHEEDFKRLTPSRRLLEQAFTRLGPCAQDYYQGLLAQRGQGAGHHLQRILRLADRHGTAVVMGAMAHAARYGNYSASAVAHLILGRPEAPAPRTAPDDGLASAPPERVRRWLEGMHVEQRELTDYDRMIAELDAPLPDELTHPLEQQLHGGQELHGSLCARAPRVRSEPSPSDTPEATPDELRPSGTASEAFHHPRGVLTRMPTPRKILPTTLDELRRNLEQLKLHAMLAGLDESLQQAQTLQQGYSTFLASLLDKEVLARAESASARRIKAAAFPARRPLTRLTLASSQV